MHSWQTESPEEMNLNIHKLEEVWTADGKKVGLAEKIYHRVKGADPELELYESYLEIENFELGSSFFVPFDFIRNDEVQTERIELAVTFDDVHRNTWTRMPFFVAHGEAREETLSEPANDPEIKEDQPPE